METHSLTFESIILSEESIKIWWAVTKTGPADITITRNIANPAACLYAIFETYWNAIPKEQRTGRFFRKWIPASTGGYYSDKRFMGINNMRQTIRVIFFFFF
jgi:hypothetical protein